MHMSGFLMVSPSTGEDRRARIRGLIDFLRYLKINCASALPCEYAGESRFGI
ncbi:MAG: hypothetical protein WKF84_08095 [Pyrinomonadaceae bacterium]